MAHDLASASKCAMHFKTVVDYPIHRLLCRFQLGDVHNLATLYVQFDSYSQGLTEFLKFFVEASSLFL